MAHVRILAAGLIVFLASCAAPPQREPQSRTPALPKSVEIAHPVSPAYLRLIDEGQALLAQGEMAKAIAIFERAQRIHADDARVYLALSKAYKQAGDNRSARAMAERGLLYCQNDKQCGELRAYSRLSSS